MAGSIKLELAQVHVVLQQGLGIMLLESADVQQSPPMCIHWK